MTRRHDNVAVRRLDAGDLPAVLAIQCHAYPVFLREDIAAFASRLDLPDTYCLGAMDDGTLVAYLIAHGWPGEAPPPVGAVVTAEPASEVLFVHDLAVSPAGQGLGIGRMLVERAIEMAASDGLTRAELIAVEGAESYWRTLGFAEAEMPRHLAEKVAAYGLEARWMARNIAAAPS